MSKPEMELEITLLEIEETSIRLRLADQFATILCPGGGLPSHESIVETLAVRDAESARILRAKREALICAVFDKQLRNGSIDGLCFSNPVSFEREARLPCGNADRIIKHADGTLTVVEVKASGSRRDHAQGIGQVLLYAAAVRATRDVQDVRGMLVVGGRPDEWIEAACKYAGIEYLAITNCETDLEVKFADAWMRGKEPCGRA